MYSAAKVNQFEMKDTCFEFPINVMGQGNSVKKTKFNLKINLKRFAVLIFCEIKDNTLGFCLVSSRHVYNPVKQIIWSVLQK